MSKKTKKNIKVRDLKPKKDAKGGGFAQSPNKYQQGTSPTGSAMQGTAPTGSALSNTGQSNN
jgi:hypothetical protein